MSLLSLLLLLPINKEDPVLIVPSLGPFIQEWTHNEMTDNLLHSWQTLQEQQLVRISERHPL